MLRHINRLNEEIARWAFEIIFKKNREWVIAFTNPTAGPWKTIKAASLIDNKYGEVYRFILEEDRPDIIMYNDKLKVIIIFEAKDCLNKLLESEQSKKSAAVVCKLAKILKDKKDNIFWQGRENYKVIVGLLWGSTDYHESLDEKNKLFDLYHSLVSKDKLVCSDILLGIETLYSNDELKCYAFYKNYLNDDNDAKIITSSLIK